MHENTPSLTQVIDLSTPGDRGRATKMFGVLPGDKEAAKLEQDGFPQIGTLLQEDDPYYRWVGILTIGGDPVTWLKIDYILLGQDRITLFPHTLPYTIGVQ